MRARAARVPSEADALAKLEEGLLAVKAAWKDVHGRVCFAALNDADKAAVHHAQRACRTEREKGGTGWVARLRGRKVGGVYWEDDAALLGRQHKGMKGGAASPGFWEKDGGQSWTITGAGFNTIACASNTEATGVGITAND